MSARFGHLSHGICAECDECVAINTFGWYRCRACGYESLRTTSETDANNGRERAAGAPRLGLSLSPTSHKESAQ